MDKDSDKDQGGHSHLTPETNRENLQMMLAKPVPKTKWTLKCRTYFVTKSRIKYQAQITCSISHLDLGV